MCSVIVQNRLLPHVSLAPHQPSLMNPMGFLTAQPALSVIQVSTTLQKENLNWKLFTNRLTVFLYSCRVESGEAMQLHIRYTLWASGRQWHTNTRQEIKKTWKGVWMWWCSMCNLCWSVCLYFSSMLLCRSMCSMVPTDHHHCRWLWCSQQISRFEVCRDWRVQTVCLQMALSIQGLFIVAFTGCFCEIVSVFVKLCLSAFFVHN